MRFLGFTRDAFRVKLDSILAHNVMDRPGAEFYGARLRDGSPTTVSKPRSARSDLIHVTQHIVAWAEKGIFCKLDYDLRIHAWDINGNEISPFWGGPYYEWDPPFIHTTRIKVENSDANCSGGFWPTVLPFLLNGLEDDLEKALTAQSPTEIQSAPPKHHHYCFPGRGEGIAGALFWNGGLTVCADSTP